MLGEVLQALCAMFAEMFSRFVERGWVHRLVKRPGATRENRIEIEGLRSVKKNQALFAMFAEMLSRFVERGSGFTAL